MSIKIMAEVWDHAPVSGGALLFLLALADQAGDADRCSWPGAVQLSQRARCDERSAYRHAARLQKHNIIVALEGDERPARYSRGRGRETTCWRINPVSEWVAEPEVEETPDNLAPLTEETPDPCHHGQGTPDPSVCRTITTHQEKNHQNTVAPRGATSKLKRERRSSWKKQEDDGAELESIGSPPADDPVEETPAPRTVLRKPKRGWTATTLVGSFHRRALEATDVPDGARITIAAGLRRILDKWIVEGTATPDEIATAMDVFFVAPATRLHGEAQLWLAFVNHYSTIAQQASKPSLYDTDHYKEPNVKNTLAGRKRA